jgi:hypothetical protein
MLNALRVARWTMGLGKWISRIRAWFRVGYPTDAPPHGYIPILALLPRRLTNDEISIVTTKLMTPRRWPVSTVDIGVEVTKITRELPSSTDIARVQRRLDAR